MQKRRLILILIGLLVLFSLIQLHALVQKHSSDIDKTSVVRFKYLIAVHAAFIICLLSFLYFEQFHQNAIIFFLFSLFVTLALFMCQQQIKKLPGHKEADDYLLFRENKFKEDKEKTFLALYYLIYMYSILNTILVGFFLLIRQLFSCYYQRQLHRQLQNAVTCIDYSAQLKGKQCTICISDFIENVGQGFYQINSCQHVFHVNCIKQWVNYSKTCPLCRAGIVSNRRSNRQFIF